MSTALRTRTSRDPLFSVWDQFFTPATRPTAAPFTPAFEVKETPEAFVLRADVPGVTDANLDINVADNVLTVSGSRASEDRKEGESFALYERRFGSFTRSFALSENADGDRISAALEHGVLTLTIPKKAEVKPRKIEIKR